MYSRFTDRARKVMQLANQEAQRFNHEYIGTEHILLGLVKEGFGIAAGLLKSHQIELGKIRQEVEKRVRHGSGNVMPGKLPQTSGVKRSIENAIELAGILDCNYVCTEHLLHGLLREPGSVAAEILIGLGLKLDRIRQRIVHIISKHPKSHECGRECMGRLRFLARNLLRNQADLTIFVGGVVATVSAEWIVFSLGGDAGDVGAVLGGLVYVIAVALGFSASRRGPKQLA
jgi:ATP-dependent Clp protease ATP-binding subunit ClpA